MEYNRVQLKTAARQAMKYQRPHPMLITLLFSILVSVGSRIISTVLGAASGSASLSTAYGEAILRYGGDIESAIQFALLSFGPQRLAMALFLGVFISGIITTLWAGLMRVGYSGFCLGMVRGQQPQTNALFSVFPQWAGVLLTQFLAGLFRSLWALLLGVGFAAVILVSALLFIEIEVLFIIVLLAAYIVFLLGLVWVTLRYAMVDFLIADQGLTGMDAIRESKRLMRGNTGRLFTLELSFAGWYLLEMGVILVICIVGLLMFGPEIEAATGTPEALTALVMSMLGIIGLVAFASIGISIFNLWLTPYVTGTEALFYDHLRGVDSRPASGYGYGPGGRWDQPYPSRPSTGYTWKPTPGPTSGAGIGPGPQGGENGPQPPQPPQQPPKPPKSPKDDPWD